MTTDGSVGYKERRFVVSIFGGAVHCWLVSGCLKVVGKLDPIRGVWPIIIVCKLFTKLHGRIRDRDGYAPFTFGVSNSCIYERLATGAKNFQTRVLQWQRMWTHCIET